MYNHILSIILFTPLVGAILLMLLPKENKDAIRWVGNIFGILGFAVSLPLIPWFWALKDRAGFQFVERHPGAREGILRLVPGAADRHARRLHGQRHVPVLRFLGGHAGADVPADRHLGRPAQTVRRH